MLNFYTKSLIVSVFLGTALEVNAQDMTFNTISANGSNDHAVAYTSVPRDKVNALPTSSGSVSNEETGSVSSVAIGKQIWMKTNLEVSKYRNGDEIPHVQDPAKWATITTGAWCYYENKTENGTVYGKLYNWYAVHDPRGLAPAGWHIPSDEEWTALTNHLGGESKAGAKMRTKINGSDDFTALLAGSRNDYSGKFTGMERCGMWWSSTAVYGSYAWYRCLYQNNVEVTRNYLNKTLGFSVRCVKD